jgi:hypothetical protein
MIWKKKINLRVFHEYNFESSDFSARNDCKGFRKMRRAHIKVFFNVQHFNGYSIAEY